MTIPLTDLRGASSVMVETWVAEAKQLPKLLSY
jgi:hypothetical protein